MSVNELSAVDESDIASVLLTVRKLIDGAMLSCPGDSVSRLTDRQTVREIIRTMIINAVQDVHCVASTVFFAQELVNAINDLAQDGVHTEVLCDRSVAFSEVGLALTNCRTATVRVAPWSMPDLLLVDGDKAISRLPTAGREVLCMRGNDLVELLHVFYAEAWSAAHSFVSCAQLTGLRSCAQTQRVMTQLTQGYKDDVAARQLGVSVRTYRRYVADLLRDLDAQSRFQAGVRAAQLGLMSASG